MKPNTVGIRNWTEIEQFYTDLIMHGWKLDPLLELVRHIITTKLSERLFGSISLSNLIVGIYNPMEWDREALHIEFNRQTQKWLFKYYPMPYKPIEFERQYPAEKGIEKFDNFIQMMKW